MAKKPEKKPAEKREGTEHQKALLARVRERHKALVDAPHETSNREQALSDMRFLHIPGEQWEANQKKRRGKRPCFEFNLTGTRAMRVINDMRANRAAGKVRAFEDGDKDTAEVYEGLIRNICNTSNFEAIQDYAAGYQVGGGMGAWRVETKYSDDSPWDQDIKLSSIKNPFCLYLTDDEAIYTDRITNAEYERRWPKAERTDFEESEFDDESEDWSDEETVRICEYWYKEPITREILLLSDGRSVDAKQPLPEGAEIKRRRTVRTFKICMCIASGMAILEKAEWLGTIIPFVQVFGQWLIIDGKVHWYGLVRNGKDAQRSYNVAHTAVVETIAAAPQAKYWATAKQAEGHVDKWAVAHEENLPAMLYNADPATGGRAPERMGGADVPVALIQQLNLAEQALNGVLGIHEASLGERGDEKSGRAISARQAQGEIATYNFKANMAEGIKRTWEILIDLIPRVITNERAIRILGADGAEKYVKVNSTKLDPKTLTMLPVNDLTRGKYDVTVTVGPSYATRRQEAAEILAQMAAQDEGLMASASDLVYKSLDVMYADEIAERRRALLPPPIQQLIAQDKPVPPEVSAVLAQAQQAMQQVQEQGAMVQQAAQEASQQKAEADKAKAEIQTAIANLKTQEAQFEAKVAKELSRIEQARAQLEIKEIQTTVADGEAQAVAGEREAMAQEAQQAVAAIQQLTAEFMDAAAQALQHVETIAAQPPPVAPPEPPKRRVVRAKRVNDELIGTLDELDEAGNVTNSREMRVKRVNGELIGQA